MSHSLQQCKHGVLVAQCRCPGPKAVQIVACPSDCLLGGTPESMKPTRGYLQLGAVLDETNFFNGPADWAPHTPVSDTRQGESHGDECPCTDCQRPETD